jgi:lactate dehydrogenase-like 2-hydroxyacid dehydrogenase
MSVKTKLLVTCKPTEAAVARIERDYDAAFAAEEVKRDPAKLIELSAGMAGIFCNFDNLLDADVFASLADSVGIIATFAVGYENIDLEAAAAKGVVITNTPDVLTDATAEIAMLLMLGAARRAHEGTTLVRTGRWKRPTDILGTQLSGKRLGIVGLGRIGKAVASRARAFAMEVHYHDVARLPAELEEGARFHADLNDMLPLSEFISLHCTLSPETRGYLNAERLARLPDGAVVVNAARGPMVDDEALIAALRSGKVAAAGLDVFDNEPDLNPAYLELPNTFLLPHMGSATLETRDAMGFKALDNLDAFFAGKPPPDRVEWPAP